MAILTQGTQIYFIDPDDDSVVEVTCATGLNLGGNPADQIETTCLSASDRTYVSGLRTPGAASISINPDEVAYDAHYDMFELSQRDPSPVLKWAVGWSNGTAAPTVDTNGDWVIPNTRTFFTFEGYISDMPFDFAQNTVVSGEVSIQRSGALIQHRKTA